jgi:hypothetical protein
LEILQRASRVSGVTGTVRQARELLAPVYGWFTEAYDARKPRFLFVALAYSFLITQDLDEFIG